MTDHRRTLTHALGAWYRDDHKWRWWLSPCQRRLYVREGGQIIELYKAPRQRHTRRQQFHILGTLVTLPQCVRITAWQDDDDYVTEGLDTANETTLEANDSPITTWEVEDERGELTREGCKAALMTGSIVAVSDSSFKDARRTSGLMLWNVSNKHYRQANNFVPGHSSAQSAYRSEIAGAVGILALLEEILQGKRTTHPVTIGFDGATAMKNIESMTSNPSQASFDLITEAQHRIRRIQCPIQFKWIRGHQDDHVGHLDLWAQLNVKMDLSAKRFWKETLQRPHIHVWISQSDRWQLRWQGIQWHQWTEKELYEWMQEDATQEYWNNKFSWLEGVFEQVDWRALALARRSKKTKQSTRRFITKMATGFLSTDKKTKQMHGTDTNKCIMCKEPEDNQHIIRCSQARTEFTKATEVLGRHLTHINTDPAIHRKVLNGIRRWHRGASTGSTCQESIEWHPLFYGFISKQWRRDQERWLLQFDSKKWHINTRLSEFIRRIWEIPWHMWQHRNRQIHDPDGEVATLRLMQADDTIKAEFRAGRQSLLSEDYFRLQDRYKVLKFGLEEKESWIRSQALARDAYARSLQRPGLTQMRNTMARWLRKEGDGEA